MKRSDVIICASIPLAALLAFTFSKSGEAIVSSLHEFALALTPVFEEAIVFVWFVLGWTSFAVLTGFVGWQIHSTRLFSGSGNASATVCALVSSAATAFLFWNAATLTIIFALLLAFAFLRRRDVQAKDGEANAELMENQHKNVRKNVPVLALVFLLLLFVNNAIQYDIKILTALDKSSRSHEMSPEELTQFDAELRTLSEGRKDSERPLRDWALSEGMTAPGVVSDRSLTIAVPGQESLVCIKGEGGFIAAGGLPKIRKMTAATFLRLCSLRSAEY